jgi:hypothetical protein
MGLYNSRHSYHPKAFAVNPIWNLGFSPIPCAAEKLPHNLNEVEEEVAKEDSRQGRIEPSPQNINDCVEILAPMDAMAPNLGHEPVALRC